MRGKSEVFTDFVLNGSQNGCLKPEKEKLYSPDNLAIGKWNACGSPSSAALAMAGPQDMASR